MDKLQPATAHQLTERLDAYFAKLATKRRGAPRGAAADLQIRIYSEKPYLDYRYTFKPEPLPFHIASIGKVFTAVLAVMLAEQGKLSLQDHISRYFSPSELDGLFVHQGCNYADKVTIEHLLGHTSGIGDYFEGAVSHGSSFMKEMLANPNHYWTPDELVDFTRQRQQAAALPGERYLYSDTGYILLGLLIQNVSGMSFSRCLNEYIIQPLHLQHTWLMFHNEPEIISEGPIAPIWFNGVNINGYTSLSCDWAGGGIVSTLDDMLTFNQALRCGKLISPASLQAMDTFKHRFRAGIYYGLGMMEIRFEQFFFLLRGLPRLRGHIGVLATHMFYDSDNDTHIIMNFGSNASMVQSFKAMIFIMSTLKKGR